MFSTKVKKNKTVLLIDDDKITHILLCEILSDELNVLTADSGTKGINILEICCEDIDLVFLDLFLPNESGFEVIDKIKQQNSNIPIVAVTAAPLAEFKKQCAEAGFNEILSKPLDIRELKETVNKYLN